MKILLVDDSKDFASLVQFCLSQETDMDLVEYVKEDEKIQIPADDFVWSDYDVLLLDYNLGGEEDGFDWLKKFNQTPGFPPAIILTAEGDEYIAIKAIKLGAADYLNKVDITPKRLIDMLRDATEQKTQVTSIRLSALEKIEQSLASRRRCTQLPSHSKHSAPSYKLIKKIGHGAMSEVYLAERAGDNFSLVLKILDMKNPPKDSSFERFAQEAQLISLVNSPFVVKIFDHGFTEDYAFIAMEFLSRGDLMQRMERRIPVDTALDYMSYIAYGLSEIHKIGVVHRDLKPANIMFRGDDSLVLADFGISKKINSTGNLTTAGKVIGTPVYMSPEQGQGIELDARSDIYSAGVIFYELLTRKKPFGAADSIALIYKHVYQDIPRLPAEVARFQDIIDKMMAKKPADRHQSAEEFIKDLEQLK